MSLNTDFDVTIIGAGPSGAMAAIRLAAFGFKVLVVDKAAFPRVKPCAGGLTVKTLNALPHSVGPIIRSVTDRFAIGVKSERRERLDMFAGADPICAFVVREEFDAFNVGKMMAAGVDFQVDGGLQAIGEQADAVELRFRNRTIRSKYVVGADGANSTVRRLMAAGMPFKRGFAIEGLVPLAKIGRMPDAEFFFGYVDNGYGWLFPKGDHINVGIYTHDDRVHLSKELLRAYCRARLGVDDLEHIVGFPLGFGGASGLANSDRILLAGDAAGFVEPMFGEGLHNAVRSGLAAADAVHAAETMRAASAGAAYRKAVAPIRADLRRCDQFKSFFYPRMDGIGFTLARLPLSKLALLKGTAAGMTMRQLTNRGLLARWFQPSSPASLVDFESRQAAHI
jgi:geranylgeranyl reductase family protein